MLTLLAGAGEIDWRAGADPIRFARGDTVLLPAALTNARLRTTEPAQWIEVTVPAAGQPVT